MTSGININQECPANKAIGIAQQHLSSVESSTLNKDPTGSELPEILQLQGDAGDEAEVVKLPWKTVKRPSKGRARDMSSKGRARGVSSKGQTRANVRKHVNSGKGSLPIGSSKKGMKDFREKYPLQNLAWDRSDAEDGDECMGLIYGCVHTRSQIESCTCSECMPVLPDGYWNERSPFSDDGAEVDEASLGSHGAKVEESLDGLLHLADLARLAHVQALVKLGHATTAGRGTALLSALRHSAEVASVKHDFADAAAWEAVALAQAKKMAVWRATTSKDYEKALAGRALRKQMLSAENAAAAKAAALWRLQELSWPRLPAP